jgi:hypothetical protein
MITMTFYDNTNNQEITYYLNEEGLVVGLEVFFFSPKDPAQIVSTIPTPVPQQPVTRTRYPVTPPYYPPVYNSPPMPSFASGLNNPSETTIETIAMNAPSQVGVAPVYERTSGIEPPPLKSGGNLRMKRGCC